MRMRSPHEDTLIPATRRDRFSTPTGDVVLLALRVALQSMPTDCDGTYAKSIRACGERMTRPAT